MVSGTDLTNGLKERLVSSLPFEDKCRLALNSFTSDVYIPKKEEIVFNWIFETLDVKYRDHIDQLHSPENSSLWETLDKCLSHSNQQEKSVNYNFEILFIDLILRL